VRDAEVAAQLAEHLAFRVSCGLPHAEAAKMIFGGQDIIDNTQLFEAMDKMSAEIPVEEWAEVPSFNGRFTESELQNWAEQLTQEMMSK
jgi:hypothetical protein